MTQYSYILIKRHHLNHACQLWLAIKNAALLSRVLGKTHANFHTYILLPHDNSTFFPPHSSPYTSLHRNRPHRSTVQLYHDNRLSPLLSIIFLDSLFPYPSTNDCLSEKIPSSIVLHPEMGLQNTHSTPYGPSQIFPNWWHVDYFPIGLMSL